MPQTTVNLPSVRQLRVVQSLCSILSTFRNSQLPVDNLRLGLGQFIAVDAVIKLDAMTLPKNSFFSVYSSNVFSVTHPKRILIPFYRNKRWHGHNEQMNWMSNLLQNVNMFARCTHLCICRGLPRNVLVKYLRLIAILSFPIFNFTFDIFIQ